MPRPIRVGIVGAGVGGLCLAQALSKAGIAATVFERDDAPNFRGQGYRVTIHESGSRFLEQCLPPMLYTRFIDNSYQWNGMRLIDHKLRKLVEILPTEMKSRSVDRSTLRSTLLEGLGDVRFGKRFTRYEEDDEAVYAYTEDGQRESFDVLVGGDGTASRVRRQKLPEHAELLDTGFLDIAARLPWNEQIEKIVAGLDAKSLIGVLSNTPETLIIIPQIYGASDADRARSYLYWGLVVRRDKMSEMGIDITIGVDLKKAAVQLTGEFHPIIRDMIKRTPDNDITGLYFRTSVPHGAWKTSRVTLLGDAIHSMTPMAGAGANTAIRDAIELARRLCDVAEGKMTTLEALSSYESAMIEYGFRAVNTSNSNLAMSTSESFVVRSLRNMVLLATSKIAPRLFPKIILSRT